MKAAISGMNLVQLNSNIRVDGEHKGFDENAAEAAEIMYSQFPEDYPEDHKPPAPKPMPSAEELAQKEHNDLINYSKKVSEEAKNYVDSLRKEEDDKKERQALSRMGMEGEPMNLQIKSKKDESLRISLAQQKQSESLVTEEGADKGAADILAAQSPEQ